MGRREQAEASRSRLVAAARSVFAERGYDRATVAEILDRAGMARGALYHYFPDGKRAIFSAVFESVNEDFHDRRDEAASHTRPMERLRAGIAAFLTMCMDPDFARIAVTDAPRLVPGQAERGSSYQLMHEQLELAAATGALADGIEAEVAALTLYGAVRAAGAFVIEAEDQQRAVALASTTIDHLLDGLARR